MFQFDTDSCLNSDVVAYTRTCVTFLRLFQLSEIPKEKLHVYYGTSQSVILVQWLSGWCRRWEGAVDSSQLWEEWRAIDALCKVVTFPYPSVWTKTLLVVCAVILNRIAVTPKISACHCNPS